MKAYRVLSSKCPMENSEGKSVAFTSIDQARAWALRKLEEGAKLYDIVEIELDPAND